MNLRTFVFMALDATIVVVSLVSLQMLKPNLHLWSRFNPFKCRALVAT